MKYGHKILNLLATANKENIELAYQLLQPHLGVETLTELYLVYFVTENKELEKDVLQLLNQYAPASFINFCTAPNHLPHKHSYWVEGYVVQGDFSSFFADGTLNVDNMLYFLRRLLPFEEMDSSIKGLFIEYGTVAQVKKLIYILKNKNSISLNYCNLKHVPAVVLEMKGLRRLELSHNHIEILPEDIFEQLPKLTTLLLKNNQLQELPEGIEQVTKLQNLDLSGNQLKKLPAAVGTH